MLKYLSLKASFHSKIKSLAWTELLAEMEDLKIVRQDLFVKYGKELWFSGWELIQQIDNLLKD